jgi:hypothetical protein
MDWLVICMVRIEDESTEPKISFGLRSCHKTENLPVFTGFANNHNRPSQTKHYSLSPPPCSALPSSALPTWPNAALLRLPTIRLFQ